jgi:hypothetical protein
MILFSGRKKHILFNGYYKLRIMSSKKSEKSDKPEDKKDKSAMTEINNMQKTIKTLTDNLNKLKTKFKTKSEGVKKE